MSAAAYYPPATVIGLKADGVTQCDDEKGGEHATVSSRVADESGNANLRLLCIVAFIEGADAQLLPATFRALMIDLGLSPVGLGRMSLAQSLFMAVASPVWGVFADKGERKSLLVISCAVWGVLTLMLSLVSSEKHMLFLRCAHGATLASMNPIGQSVIADIVGPEGRGAAFGRLHFALHAGQVLASLIGLSVANRTITRGVKGWRFLFAGMAVVAVAAAVILHALFLEPQRQSHPRDTRGMSFFSRFRNTILGEVRRVVSYLRIRSFRVIVFQGVFGSVPWNALSFLPLYLVYCGKRDVEAAVVISMMLVGGSLGGLIGGAIGDGLARRNQGHGRPCTAQLSVCAGLPLISALLLLARSGSSTTVLALLALTLGSSASWCAVGVNRPIMTEIVDPNCRASIIAWIVAMDGSSAALFGAPVVGLLAERVFGYRKMDSGSTEFNDVTSRDANADALLSAMLWCTLLPWTICFCFYTMLHCTYQKDRELASASQKEVDAAKKNIELSSLAEDGYLQSAFGGTVEPSFPTG
eukprot:TRINITY_DN61019_c0_g1_i1.p1 TRINITY_DN61019_c0_g1~~TRINITY_DN61019_c0_g1_i1.p1  ORF type:complete len:528 (+),score=44.01 TRINITY_DN61019_c0_g1_i1:74-1657(+)